MVNKRMQHFNPMLREVRQPGSKRVTTKRLSSQSSEGPSPKRKELLESRTEEGDLAKESLNSGSYEERLTQVDIANTAKTTIDKGADVNKAYQGERVSLLLAVKSGDIEVVNALIDIGKDVNQKYQGGWTPLLLAIQSGRVDVVDALIGRGADVNKTHKGGLPPLILAVSYGYVEIVKILITAGANVNKVYRNGWPPILLLQVAMWRR